MKFFKNILLKENLHFYIYLLIGIKFVLNDYASSNGNCNGCEVIDNKCKLRESCSTEGCKCIANCRPHLYNNDKCYDCTEAFSSVPGLSIISKVYYINSNDECIYKSISNCKKITIENNECVDNCGTGYEFGDFCYSSCTSESKLNMEEGETTPIKKCQCKNNYKIMREEEISDKEYLRCLESCPFGYYYDLDNYCIKKCEDIISAQNLCTVRCNNDKYLLIQEETINEEIVTKKYCVDHCPDDAKFYYPEEKECKKECDSEDFIDYINSNECLSECNNMTLVDVDSKNYKCSNITTPTPPSNLDYKCNSDYPYQYGHYCLRSCYDTRKLDIFGNKTTYFLLKTDGDTTHKFCSDECNEDSEQKYMDLSTLSCQKNCKETSNKYFFGKNCIYNCSLAENSFNLNLNDTGECVKECPGGYHLLEEDKTCYKKCPTDSEYKYIDIHNNCNTCKIPDLSGIIREGEGFIYEEEGENKKLYCKDSCSKEETNEGEEPVITYYYHKEKDNICLVKNVDCESNEDEYKYSIGKEEEKNYICYKSCKDIPGEYIYQYNYKCYKELQDDLPGFSKNFYQDSGIYIYLKEEDDEKEICSKKHLYFQKDHDDEYKECVEDCDPEEFKILYSLGEDGIIKEFGKCEISCPTNGDNPYPFYSLEKKICYKDCPYKTIAKVTKEDDNIVTIPVTNEENCLNECPPLYPYESKDGKYCYDNCPKKFYFEYNNKKICADTCGSKFYFNNEFKCLDECVKVTNSNETKYYYYNNNHECIDTCNKINEEFNFAFEAKQSPQPCIKECPSGYKYFESDKLCLNDCENGFLENVTSSKCLTSCENGQYIIKENICSNNCTDEQPFHYSLTIGTNTMKKCVPNCEKENPNYKFYESDGKGYYECITSCLNPKVVYEKECRDKCPKGLFQENNICGANCVNQKYFQNESNVYQCKDYCPYQTYITSNNECKNKCPIGENYIGAGNICKSSCSSEDGEFYTNINNENEFGDYPIYKCGKKCSELGDLYLLENTKECVSECPSEYYISEYNKMCYFRCSKDNKYSFSIPKELSTSDPKVNECNDVCPDSAENYGEDKICVNGCNHFTFTNIINKKDNSCVSKCDINSDYKYLYIDDNSAVDDGTNADTNADTNTNNIKRYCLDDCAKGGNKNKYVDKIFQCVEKCEEPNNFLINNKICSDKCINGQFAEIKENGEYVCQPSCNAQHYYYENKNICLENCTDDYNVENTQKCTKNCTELNTNELNYYFYEPKDVNSIFKMKTCVTQCPSDKPLKDIIDNHCYNICPDAHKYQLSNECVEKCPTNYLVDEYECVLRCPPDKFEDETGKCINSCNSLRSSGPSEYKYYYNNKRKCLLNCNENDFIDENNECVSSCTNESMPFIYNKKCVEFCPQDKKYFVGNFENGEEDQNQYCLSDCPIDYPFYTIDKNNSCKCSRTCPNYYISNRDPNINAKECVSKCEGDYQRVYIYNNTHKECLEICPKYYIELENSDSESEYKYECFNKCPSTHPYHERDSYKCLKICPWNYANFTDKTCLSNCEKNNFWIKENSDQDGIEMKLCLKECSEVNNNLFSTPDRECVDLCDESKFLRGNRAKHICECIKLYYNKDGIINCLPDSISKCGEKSTEYPELENYAIQINGTNECVENCFGVLSLSEDVCDLNYICPPNSKMGISNGKIKCECQYKYYFDANGKTKCLDENDSCPNNYNYLIPDKNQCVQDCTGYNFIFDNKCLESCPHQMTEKGEEYPKTCECSFYWYKESDNKYTCLNSNECNTNYPYLKKGTTECVNKCDKDYSIFYNNECVSSCGDDKMEKIEVDPSYPTYNISHFTCRCKYIWAEGKCDATENSCKNFGELKYLVKETKECVKTCPDYYKFYFNNECFQSCKQAKTKYGYNIKEIEGSNECVCEKFWRINEEDKNLTECLDQCERDEILIENIKQCVKKEGENFICPSESPYYYNQRCYSKCPNGTSIDIIKGETCKCDNIWFQQENNIIVCPENKLEKCPANTHPYYINETKECVKSCTETYPKIFNYICYRNCPYLTNDNNNNNNQCECDNINYFWYKYQDQNDFREYLVCGLDNCTNADDKPLYINKTHECVKKCGDFELYEFANVCYEECPLFTQKNSKDYFCEISTENEDIKDLIGNVSDKIADIYDDLPEGGLVVNNEEVSLQIYGLKRNESANNINAIKKSNLAYIDLSGCIQKIFESNQNKDEVDSIEDIVVVKLDLKSKNKKLIINPVEYQFINSKNGKILDASVCEKNEVVISYPITYMLKTKKKLRNLEEDDDDEEKIQKEISEKFDIGKTLNEKDKSIDTFNYNNSIYTDICTPVEVEGKDLVLEDRIQSLFPNYSFCESVCTYDYTDFQGERIYCNCSIKSGIDIDRPHSVKIFELNEEELKNNQKGPTNLPILKCISKAKISGNAAFYYCIIFIIVEVGLLLIIIFYGISSLIDKIKDKILKINDEKRKIIEYNSSENDKIKENIKDKDKEIKYSTNSSNNDDSNRNVRNITRKRTKPIHVKINANPPKIGQVGEEDEDEKNKPEEEMNNIQKIKIRPIELNDKNIIDEKKNFDIFSDGQNEIEINKYLQKNEIETQMGFYYSMRKEEKLLRTKYIHSLENDKFDSIIVVLTSVFDKIYIVKILLLSGKYEIVPLMFSLYLLCHMLLLTFLTFFYDIKTIGKIWQNQDYPSTNYYLSYGFWANIIVWIIYRIFCCLLNNEYKIRRMKNLKNMKFEKKGNKINNIIYKIKRNMVVYLTLQFLIILFCSFYLITFCGIYIGTKSKIFQSYGIAFIEIIIIKILYGLILGILRKISLLKKISILYNIILIFNKYIS